jgi:hypothetical protein
LIFFRKGVKHHPMANQRGENQVLIGFWAEQTFCDKIKKARGPVPMSRYLRIAVADYLRRHGYEVTETELENSDRAGKGGRPRRDPAAAYNKPAPKVVTAAGHQLSSGEVSQLQATSLAAEQQAGYHAKESPLSPPVAGPSADTAAPSPNTSRRPSRRSKPQAKAPK